VILCKLLDLVLLQPQCVSFVYFGPHQIRPEDFHRRGSPFDIIIFLMFF
jgi:hypothetical protein